jgi:hypothetical protein
MEDRKRHCELILDLLISINSNFKDRRGKGADVEHLREMQRDIEMATA